MELNGPGKDKGKGTLDNTTHTLTLTGTRTHTHARAPVGPNKNSQSVLLSYSGITIISGSQQQKSYITLGNELPDKIRVCVQTNIE